MEASEAFSLRWDNFETNFRDAFKELRDAKDFFDCTLTCGSIQIQAHRLILSACSPIFRSIFRENPHHHPFIYLRGIEHGDLEMVLNFMYYGEVEVAQTQLNSFLTVAEDLKVKGLSENRQVSCAHLSEKPGQGANLQQESEPMRRSVLESNVTRRNIIQRIGSTENTLNQSRMKSDRYGSVDQAVNYSCAPEFDVEMLDTIVKEQNLEDNKDSYVDEVKDGYLEILEQEILEQDKDIVAEYARKVGGGKYSCNLCGAISRDKTKMRGHLKGRKHRLSQVLKVMK